MPILSADALEQAVIKAVFGSAVEQRGERLQDEINAAIERQRTALLEALELLEQRLSALAQERNDALAAVMDRALSPTLKAAMAERAEHLVVEYQEGVAQQQQIRVALDSLAAKARSALAVLTDPNLDPARWREPAVFGAFRRALSLLVKKAVVRKGSTRLAFFVELTVTADPIAEPQNGPVPNTIFCPQLVSLFVRKCGILGLVMAKLPSFLVSLSVRKCRLEGISCPKIQQSFLL
jgi:hypothetical protein